MADEDEETPDNADHATRTPSPLSSPTLSPGGTNDPSLSSPAAGAGGGAGGRQHSRQGNDPKPNRLWMDSLKAPLNPCSLESLPTPVTLADGVTQVWPTMLGCYQLDDPKRKRRLGQLNLYNVRVPDIANSNSPTVPLSFGDPQVVVDPAESARSGGGGGILDGKWLGTPLPPSAPFCDGYRSTWAFATAHSSGDVRVHTFHVPTYGDDDVRGDGGGDLLDSDPLYTVQCNVGAASSSKGSGGIADGSSSDAAPLCLSLNWGSLGPSTSSSEDSVSRRIVSTFSNGMIALYDVVFLNDGAQIIESDRWEAHDMFGTPSEVWSAGISGTNTVVSGGDCCRLKFWDARSTLRPTQVLQFDAGVTCVSPHPTLPHLVACGGYDERLLLFDVRYMTSHAPLCQSRQLGGGVWRIQWHPYNPHRVLVAAMHGGCRVMNIKGFDRYCREHPPSSLSDERQELVAYSNIASSFSSSWDSSALECDLPMYAKVKKKFCEHESMAYGASWLVCRHPRHPNSYFEAAASCSFYDRSVFLWDSVF